MTEDWITGWTRDNSDLPDVLLNDMELALKFLCGFVVEPPASSPAQKGRREHLYFKDDSADDLAARQALTRIMFDDEDRPFIDKDRLRKCRFRIMLHLTELIDPPDDQPRRVVFQHRPDTRKRNERAALMAQDCVILAFDGVSRDAALVTVAQRYGVNADTVRRARNERSGEFFGVPELLEQIDGVKIRVEEAMAAGKAALAQADAPLERAEAGDRSALEEAAQHTHTPIGCAVRADKVLGAQTADSALVQFVQDVRGFLPSSAGSNGKEFGVHAEPVHDEQDLERSSWSPVQASTSAAYKSLTVCAFLAGANLRRPMHQRDN